LKKNILVVDNLTDRIIFFIERFGSHNLTIIENSEDAIYYLKHNVYDYIFFGGNLNETGRGCAEVAIFLKDNPDNPNNNSMLIIHSWDVSIVYLILQSLPKAIYLPFTESDFTTLFNI